MNINKNVGIYYRLKYITNLHINAIAHVPVPKAPAEILTGGGAKYINYVKSYVFIFICIYTRIFIYIRNKIHINVLNYVLCVKYEFITHKIITKYLLYF